MSLSPVDYVTIDFDNPIDEIANLLAYYSPRPGFKLLYRRLAAHMFGCADNRFGMWCLDTNSDDEQISGLLTTAVPLRESKAKSFVVDEILDGLIKVKRSLDAQTMTAWLWLRTLTVDRVSPTTAIFRVNVKPCELTGDENDDAPVELSWAVTVAAGGVWVHSAKHVSEHGKNLSRIINEDISSYTKQNHWFVPQYMTGALVYPSALGLEGDKPVFSCAYICSIQELKNAIGFGDPAKTSWDGQAAG